MTTPPEPTPQALRKLWNFTPELSRAETLSFDWISEVWLRNFIILFSVACVSLSGFPQRWPWRCLEAGGEGLRRP